MSDLNGEKIGLNAAVGAIVQENGLPPAPGNVPVEQLALLPLRQAGFYAEAEKEDATSRGAGRPPGAKNRRTQEWVDYILNRYPSPLIALAETYARPIDDLIKELKCDRLEAFKLQMAAAKELAPYIHQKMPMAIETGDKGLIHLTINAGSAQAAKDIMDSNVMDVKFLPIEGENGTQQNQGFIGNETENSNGFNSNGNQETPINTGSNDERSTD